MQNLERSSLRFSTRTAVQICMIGILLTVDPTLHQTRVESSRRRKCWTENRNRQLSDLVVNIETKPSETIRTVEELNTSHDECQVLRCARIRAFQIRHRPVVGSFERRSVARCLGLEETMDSNGLRLVGGPRVLRAIVGSDGWCPDAVDLFCVRSMMYDRTPPSIPSSLQKKSSPLAILHLFDLQLNFGEHLLFGCWYGFGVLFNAHPNKITPTKIWNHTHTKVEFAKVELAPTHLARGEHARKSQRKERLPSPPASTPVRHEKDSVVPIFDPHNNFRDSSPPSVHHSQQSISRQGRILVPSEAPDKVCSHGMFHILHMALCQAVALQVVEALSSILTVTPANFSAVAVDSVRAMMASSLPDENSAKPLQGTVFLMFSSRIQNVAVDIFVQNLICGFSWSPFSGFICGERVPGCSSHFGGLWEGKNTLLIKIVVKNSKNVFHCQTTPFLIHW